MKIFKKARKNKNFTQNELTELVGAKRSTIAGYESEEREPSYKILKKIADALGSSIDSLLAHDYDNYLISETQISKEILNNKELKSLFNALKGMDSNNINFYRRLIQFIEAER